MNHPLAIETEGGDRFLVDVADDGTLDLLVEVITFTREGNGYGARVILSREMAQKLNEYIRDFCTKSDSRGKDA